MQIPWRVGGEDATGSVAAPGYTRGRDAGGRHGYPEPMPARWRLTSPALMDRPRGDRPGRVAGLHWSSDRIGSPTGAFRALPPRRRLVITGRPVTGKTTLTVLLLLKLLTHHRPGDPVPDSKVSVSASSSAARQKGASLWSAS